MRPSEPDQRYVPESELTRTYQAIKTHIESHGYPPTLRELGEAIGRSSPSTIKARLEAMVELGWITVEPGKPRAIRLER